MNQRHIKYLGYVFSVAAGLVIATDALPKALTLALFVLGVTLILFGDRDDRRIE